MLIDLQLHSTCSDGYLTPSEVAKTCQTRGVKVASLTDHNTVSGQEEFARACRQLKIKAIPGIELYATLGRKHLNLLWYNFDIDDPELHNLLRDSQNRRRTSVRRALENLVKKGYTLDIDALLDNQNHYAPINHVVDSFRKLNQARIQKELGKKNILETEIIRNYFRKPDKTRLHESYINITRVLKIKKRAGGQLVLAHPCLFRWVEEKTVRQLKSLGLDGLEVLSPHHSWEGVSYLQAMASEQKLIMSGGSDFHRFEAQKWYAIKSSWNYFAIESKLLKGVEKIIS